MRTTLVFVRHGSTEWTAPPSRYQGRTDPALSPRGRAEAEQLAVCLPDVARGLFGA